MGLICCVSSSKWTITSCWYQETTFISNTGQSGRINVLWVLMRDLTKGLYNLLYKTLAWLVFRRDILDLDRILNPKYVSLRKRHLQMNQFHPSNKEFEIGWYSYWRVLLAAGFSHPIRCIESGWPPVLGWSYFLLPLLYNLCTKCHKIMLDILPILALLKRGRIWAGQAQKSFWDHVTADFMHYCGIFVCLLFIKSLAMKTCIKSRKAKFNAKSVKAMRLAKSEKARHAAKCVRQPSFLKLAAQKNRLQLALDLIDFLAL